MFKKLTNIVLTVLATTVLIGCSNQSPVSVSSETDIPLKTALITDATMRDFAFDGQVLWGLTNYEVPSAPGNYYIFWFNFSTNLWVVTGNYGVRISATSDGRCYHFNTSKQIWWCTKTSNGQVPNPPTGTIIDIASGSYNGGHKVWIVLNSGYDKIYTYSDLGGSWSISNPQLSPVGTTINAIACDPRYGQYPIIAPEVVSINLLKKYNGSQWVDFIGNALAGSNDISIYGNRVFARISQGLFHVNTNDYPINEHQLPVWSWASTSNPQGVACSSTKYFFLNAAYGGPYTGYGYF